MRDPVARLQVMYVLPNCFDDTVGLDARNEWWLGCVAVQLAGAMVYVYKVHTNTSMAHKHFADTWSGYIDLSEFKNFGATEGSDADAMRFHAYAPLKTAEIGRAHV